MALFKYTIVVCCILATAAAGLSFNGFRHYRLSPMSTKALERLRWLERKFPSDPDPQAGLMFLTQPGKKFKSVDVLVPPQLTATFLSLVQATGAMRMRLLHRNYGRQLAEFNNENNRARLANIATLKRHRRQADGGDPGRQRMRHNFYRTFAGIRRSLVELNHRCNEILRDTCSLETIGQTAEGRELIVLKIAKNALNQSTVWIDAGIHAREWASPATALYIADQLVNVGLPASLSSASRSQSNFLVSEAAELVDKHQILLLVMYNPDGYEYSRLHDRLWRKNRERNVYRRSCPGVDLNRNYGYRWGSSAGSSGNPCTSTYRGSAPFSAAETTAVRQYLEAKKSQLLMFLSLHSYGQYLLLPYGYQKNTYSKTHHEKMMCAATMAIYKMFIVNDRFYSLGTGSDLLYEANGGSDDWAHGTLKVPYSFTVELPDEGEYGFLLPGYMVPSLGNEVMRGLSALLSVARRLEGGRLDSTEALAECAGFIE